MPESADFCLPAVTFLYGPSGSGKSSAGRRLAEALGQPFIDLDEVIENQAGLTIAAIFTQEGESGFRVREQAALRESISQKPAVIALGGGALLEPASRELAEANGRVICLNAPYETLLSRLQGVAEQRPLLAADLPERLRSLLNQREAHYASFPQLDTSRLTIDEAAWQIQVLLGQFRVQGMGVGYRVYVRRGGLSCLGEVCQETGLKGPVALVSDEQVTPLYSQEVLDSLEKQGYTAHLLVLPAGETHKTPATVQRLWEQLIPAGFERQSTVIALGGGVVTDIAGFTAATFLRGVNWVACPTTLLGMVDASLGGKTGVDLPQGKNLVGAFHPPALVLADPACLETLPVEELRSGLAEVVKHGVIGDPLLLQLCDSLPGVDRLEEVVRRAMAVKVQVIQADPYEKELRAVLNLGHTIGHALEVVSGYALRHGEAVAIGMVSESRLAHRMGLAEDSLEDTIGSVLRRLGLPTRIPPGLDHQAIWQAMHRDKKRRSGKLRFALPVRVGEVLPGVEVEEELVKGLLGL